MLKQIESSAGLAFSSAANGPTMLDNDSSATSALDKNFDTNYSLQMDSLQRSITEIEVQN